MHPNLKEAGGEHTSQRITDQTVTSVVLLQLNTTCHLAAGETPS